MKLKVVGAIVKTLESQGTGMKFRYQASWQNRPLGHLYLFRGPRPSKPNRKSQNKWEWAIVTFLGPRSLGPIGSPRKNKGASILFLPKQIAKQKDGP